MNESSAKIQSMRDQQLTRGMRVVAIMGFFAVLSSLSRVLAVGWHHVMYLHIAFYLIVMGTVLFKKRLSYSFRSFVIVIIPYILGVTGMISFGIMAFGLVSFFTFCILSTLLFGTRWGTVSCGISIATIGIIGLFVHTGILVFRFNAEALMVSPTSWITAMIAIALSTGTIVVALGTLNKQVDNLIYTLEKQNEDLLQKNLLLEKEIEQRTQAEEEQQLLENRLKLAKKMESIGKLAGGVAHDLNNSLGSIIGYPDLLLDELPKDSPLRETIVAIKQSGIKAATIVNDMLTLARNGIVAVEAINLNSVLSEYSSSPEFKQLMSFHPKVTVEFRLEKQALNVRGSFFHLFKVAMNLVSNAAEAMPEGGQITLSTEKKRVDRPTGLPEGMDEGDYAVLCVSDTGIGIPPEDLERIFEPFFTKKKMGRSGTGLGMAVVWGSVKDHNGHITVDSTVDRGSKFTIYLPLTKEPLPAGKHPFRIQAPLGKGETILVIDDVKEQREIAFRILTKMGYSVHTVGSGEEALDYIRQTSVDLLIMDMLMEPGMDGLETYKKIIEIRPGQKALIATGFSETQQINEAQKLGVGGYLKKPYLLDQIASAVRTELDKATKGNSPNLWN